MSAHDFAIDLMTITMLVSFISLLFLLIKMEQYREELSTVKNEMSEILDKLKEK